MKCSETVKPSDPATGEDDDDVAETIAYPEGGEQRPAAEPAAEEPAAEEPAAEEPYT